MRAAEPGGADLPSFLRERWAAVYVVAVAGALLQIVGGYWDVAWHILGIVETFFTPPHTVLYSGIGLSMAASLAALGMRLTWFRRHPVRGRLLNGLHVAFVGGVFQSIAGPADFWWHETFGFDPFLFTPSHVLLIGGILLVGVGSAVGSVRLLQAHRAGVDLEGFRGRRRWLETQVVVALAVLWIVLNVLVYTLTDLSGIAYTFGLGEGFEDRWRIPVSLLSTGLLALTGTLVFLATKRLFPAARFVTRVALIGATVSATANLGFRAWYFAGTAEGAALAAFIPVFYAFLLPVVLFDVGLKPAATRSHAILAATLVGPFASLLDGWNSGFLWVQFPEWLPLYAVPMIIFGFLAALMRARFERAILREVRGPAPG